jgi:GNAT superfamily N-acetyltransferase
VSDSDFPFVIRSGNENDVGFIIRTWLDGTRDAWAVTRQETVKQWAATEIKLRHFVSLDGRMNRHVAAEILQRDACRVSVACDVEDPDVIFGYVISEPAARILHWVAVKWDFQRRGIGRALLKHALPDFGRKTTTMTFLPRGFVSASEQYALRFDPYAGKVGRGRESA